MNRGKIVIIFPLLEKKINDYIKKMGFNNNLKTGLIFLHKVDNTIKILDIIFLISIQAIFFDWIKYLMLQPLFCLTSYLFRSLFKLKDFKVSVSPSIIARKETAITICLGLKEKQL